MIACQASTHLVHGGPRATFLHPLAPARLMQAPREDLPVQNPCSRYGVATVLALVVLRLVIGWHFFSEGSAHLADQRWSSEGFLRMAKGPLAPHYQSVLSPAGFGFDDTLHVEATTSEDASAVIDAWRDRVLAGLKSAESEFANLYKPTEDQKKDLDKIVERRQAQFQGWLSDTREDLNSHVHDWQRLVWSKKSPSADNVPFEKKRIADAQAKLKSQTGPWTTYVRAVERGMLEEFDAQLTDAQRTAGRAVAPSSSLEKVDRVMGYGITIVGACLIVGFLARFAALAGAAFLLSVVLAQPPWLSDTVATYPQLLEMLTLLALATVPVGRWAGLDFFLQFLFSRHCCSAKGTSHESHS
jgi:uncharacterized membrane protein YphA (DoxX/SURF4 family)